VNIGDGSQRVDLQPAQLINDNEWHYLACSFDRSDLVNIYIDGHWVDSGNISDVGNIDNALEMVIGADSEYDYPINARIEEFCLYNKALSIDEIRELRHLTRKMDNPDVIAYYQFNLNPGQIFDKFGSHHLTLGNDAILAESNCPIGGGTAFKMLIDSNGNYDFTGTGLNLIFPVSATYPEGDVVVSRLNISPDTLNNDSGIFANYWIINNYGLNNTFSSASEINFSDVNALTAFDNAGSFNLYHRSENANGPVWNILDTGDTLNSNTNSLGFSFGLSLTGFGQFAFDNDMGFYWTGMVDNDWDNASNWARGMIPNPNSEVYIPKATPHYPIVNVNAQIRTLYIENGANMWIPLGRIFEVIF
jgi:hypothetical protein